MLDEYDFTNGARWERGQYKLDLRQGYRVDVTEADGSITPFLHMPMLGRMIRMDERFPHILIRIWSSGIPTPHIKDRGLRVETLVIAHHHHSETLESLATAYDLPIEIVQEALEYYDAHRDEIENLICIEDDITQFYETQRRLPNDEEFQNLIRRPNALTDHPEEDDISPVLRDPQKVIDESRTQHRIKRALEDGEIEQFYREWVNKAATPEEFERLLNMAPDVEPDEVDDRLDEDNLNIT